MIIYFVSRSWAEEPFEIWAVITKLEDAKDHVRRCLFRDVDTYYRYRIESYEAN